MIDIDWQAVVVVVYEIIRENKAGINFLSCTTTKSCFRTDFWLQRRF